MISMALTSNCPAWVDRISPAQEQRFLLQLQRVHDLVQAAATEVLIADSLLLWHAVLFSEFVPLPYYAGNFRQADSSRVCLCMPVHVDGVGGSDPHIVPSEIARLFAELRTNIDRLESRWPHALPAERAGLLSKTMAWFVGSFIRIHPFLNGNGRTSRLLWRWGLLRYGAQPQVCSHPRPDPPYATVMKQAMNGDDMPLRKFILIHLRQCFRNYSN